MALWPTDIGFFLTGHAKSLLFLEPESNVKGDWGVDESGSGIQQESYCSHPGR